MAATTTPMNPMVHSTPEVLEHLRRALITEAAAAHAQYPQYEGHWDNWRVAEITRRVRTKMGVAFQAGDLVLVAPQTTTEKVAPRSRQPIAYEDWPTKEFATAYSRRNGIDTAVPVPYVREVVTDR
jgi:hypothetical protein